MHAGRPFVNTNKKNAPVGIIHTLSNKLGLRRACARYRILKELLPNQLELASVGVHSGRCVKKTLGGRCGWNLKKYNMTIHVGCKNRASWFFGVISEGAWGGGMLRLRRPDRRSGIARR